MSEETVPQPVPEQEVKPQKKRQYQSRKHEFDDLDLPIMLIKLVEAKTLIKNANTELKANPQDLALIDKLNEVVNYRVRIYERLRKLGHSSEKLRIKKAMEKRGTIEPVMIECPTPPEAPPTETPCQG